MTNKTAVSAALLTALVAGTTLPTVAQAGAPPAASADEVAVLSAQLQQMQRDMVAMQVRLRELTTAQQAHQAEQSSLPAAADARRVESLEQQIATLSESVDASSSKSSWTDKIGVKGDFRYRYENIDDDARVERERQRLRARISIDAKVNDSTKVGIRLASGGTDPVSTNQSFDTLASTKDIRLDRAFVKHQFNDQLSVTGGKMSNSFYRPSRSTLLWDGDLNPEGLAFAYKNGGLFAHLANWVLEESSGGDDSYMHGLQAGYTLPTGNGKLTFGGGYFMYDFALALGLTEVENVEVFADYATTMLDRPLVVYADYVTNTQASDLDTGYRVGFTYGKVKAPGSWNFGLAYGDVERDALFGQFSESDFAGGGTDGEGWIINGAYGLGKNVSFGATYFLNERDVSSNERDYERLQLDVRYKY